MHDISNAKDCSKSILYFPSFHFLYQKCILPWRTIKSFGKLYYQDMPDQSPCWSIKTNFQEKKSINSDQCRSILLNKDQCELLPLIDLYWDKLIVIDRNWLAMIFNKPHFGSIPQNWLLLIGIGDWYSIVCIIRGDIHDIKNTF